MSTESCRDKDGKPIGNFVYSKDDGDSPNHQTVYKKEPCGLLPANNTKAEGVHYDPRTNEIHKSK